jgi:large subunit ribosomal protein L21
MEVRNIYAIIETGGKQYKVAPGNIIDVDRIIDVTVGNSVELDKVLLIADGDKFTVGTPTIEGAKVLATYQGEKKGDKVIVFRYKAKVRERNKTGHRTIFTKLAIDKIVEPGAVTEEEPAKKVVRHRKKEVTESGT